MNDAQYTVNNAETDAEGKTRAEKKRKMLAVAPAFVRGRVERGEELPYPVVRQGRKKEEKMRAAVVERVIGGEMAKELYYDVMDLIMSRWDDARNM